MYEAIRGGQADLRSAASPGVPWRKPTDQRWKVAHGLELRSLAANITEQKKVWMIESD